MIEETNEQTLREVLSFLNSSSLQVMDALFDYLEKKGADRATVTEIGEFRPEISPNSTNVAIGTLSRNGLVRREPDKNSPGTIFVSFSPRGKRVAKFVHNTIHSTR